MGGGRDRQPAIAAIMIRVKRAIVVEGMDRMGPPYLMARERVAEMVNTLRMVARLAFVEVVVGWAIELC
jgi:hypothetical protein